MRIAAINTVASQNNAPGQLMMDICDAVVESKGQAMAVYGRGKRDYLNRVRCVRENTSLDVLCHTLLSRICDSEGLHSQYVTQNIIKRLIDFTPDIIHIHNLHGHYINYPILMKWLKKVGIPVVWTMHDCWPFTGHCAYYAAKKCNGFLSGCKSCKYKSDYPKSLISRSSRNYLKKQDAFLGLKKMTIVAVSQWLADEFMDSFMSDYPIEIIPNGVDTDIFKPYDNTKNKKKFKILGVASKWENRKNLQFFLDLSSQIPEDIEINLVGLSQKTKLPANLKAIGSITNRSDLARIYSDADVFINPSRAETFGMTTVEALACGTPVIVNNVTAMPEVIDDEIGYAVDIDNVPSVIQIINRLKSSNEKPITLCRNHVINYYSKRLMTQSYLNLYSEILQERDYFF